MSLVVFIISWSDKTNFIFKKFRNPQALSFMGGLICNGQDSGGHGGGLSACREAHLS
jgi:hypothetical protein